MADPERLAKILAKQQEREKKLKEKERLVAEEKARKEREKKEQLEREFGHLRATAAEEDKRKGSASSNEEPRTRNEEEIRREEKIEKEKAEAGLPVGHVWQKRGNSSWARGDDSSVRVYKQNPTESFLPAWIYDELDLAFGMRRPNSRDFRDSASVLTQIMDRYMNERGELRRKMTFDVGFTVKQIIACPVRVDLDCISSSLSVVTTFISCLERNAKFYRNQAISDTQEQKLISEAKEWQRSIENRKIKDNEDSKNKHQILEDEAYLIQCGGPLFAIIDDAVLIGILSLLSPKEVGIMAQTCRRLSIIASSEIVWINLGKQRNLKPIDEQTSWRDTVITEWTKSWGKEFLPSYGLWRCDECDNFYWGAKNTKRSCMKTYGEHFGRLINPDFILDEVLSRKVGVVSDVILL